MWNCVSGIIALLMMVGNIFDEDKPTSSRVISLIVLIVIALIFFYAMLDVILR